MTRKPASPNRADLLRLFERLLKGGNCRIEIIETHGEQEETLVIENGEDHAVIPIHLAQYVFELAKTAPWPKGRHTESRLRRIYEESSVIGWARRRKLELQDGGLPPGKALKRAAKEASHRSEHPDAWIEDRMQRKRSRR
jgi:hypothetical protein